MGHLPRGKGEPGVRLLLRDSVESQEHPKSGGYKAGEQRSGLHFPLLTTARGAEGIDVSAGQRGQLRGRFLGALAWGCGPQRSGEPAATHSQS